MDLFHRRQGGNRLFVQVEGLDLHGNIPPGARRQGQVVSGHIGPVIGQGCAVGQGYRYIVVHRPQNGFPAEGGVERSGMGRRIVSGELGHRLPAQNGNRRFGCSHRFPDGRQGSRPGRKCQKSGPHASKEHRTAKSMGKRMHRKQDLISYCSYREYCSIFGG